MQVWMVLVGLALILVAVPVAVLSLLGMVLLALKIIAVVQKAAEPPTVDQDGAYSLDQGKEIGRKP